MRAIMVLMWPYSQATLSKIGNPTRLLQREFAHRIRELAELCPVVLLVGNHDLPTNVLRASSVEIYDTLAVPNVLVARSTSFTQYRRTAD